MLSIYSLIIFSKIFNLGDAKFAERLSRSL